jgi:hypothetical protein
MKLIGDEVVGGRMKRCIGIFIPFLNLGSSPL